ncbi:MAG: hypothetical protein ACPGGK_19115 [Pikeienuella sp.]
MKFLGLAIGGIMLTAGAANADVIAGYDEAGAAKSVDTAAMTGCELIFDSNGTPFELCKMEKVELRPQTSTRTRPGSDGAAAETAVVYKRASN